VWKPRGPLPLTAGLFRCLGRATSPSLPTSFASLPGNYTTSSNLAPAERAVPVTSSVFIVLNGAIHVGGRGDLAVTPLKGADAGVFESVKADAILPIFARFITGTGTTATVIVALY
jgi:hypothetical protein